MDYATLDRRLTNKRNGQPVEQRKVGNNTYARRTGPDTIAIRLHSTDVVAWHRDGTVVLDSGGWLSVTTKARITEWAGPFTVTSAGGTWTVLAANPDYVRRPYLAEGPDDRTPEQCVYWFTVGTFYDGMRLDANNPTATLDTPADVRAALEADRETRRAVAKYVKGITADVIRTAIDNAGGDCFGCRAGNGDAFGSDHLVLHMEEGYYVAHLFKNALEGYPDPVFIFRHPSMVRQAVRRYLLANLLIGPTSGRRAEATAPAGGF